MTCAAAENVVVCAWPRGCCQPGTVKVLVGQGRNMALLEFCGKHAVGASRKWRPLAPATPTASVVPIR